MLIKIKTFSGETLYLPEEDYLNEVMYSNAARRALTKPGKTAAIIKQSVKGNRYYRGVTTDTAEALMHGNRQEAIQAGTEVQKAISKGKGGLIPGEKVGRRARTDSAVDIAHHRDALKKQMSYMTPGKNTERIAQIRKENQEKLQMQANPVARHFM